MEEWNIQNIRVLLGLLKWKVFQINKWGKGDHSSKKKHIWQKDKIWVFLKKSPWCYVISENKNLTLNGIPSLPNRQWKSIQMKGIWAFFPPLYNSFCPLSHAYEACQPWSKNCQLFVSMFSRISKLSSTLLTKLDPSVIKQTKFLLDFQHKLQQVWIMNVLWTFHKVPAC